MRIVQLNLAYDTALDSPYRLLERYHTLTGWSRALAAAGAAVSVVQRYARPAEVVQEHISYAFVADRHPPLLPDWAVSAPTIERVAALEPDVVHVNGLMFPATTAALRSVLRPACVIVLQDHSGVVPRLKPVVQMRTRRRWRRAFALADACSFTARDLASRWNAVGLSRGMTVLELPEASTTLTPVSREEARARTPLAGMPAILWVGRLDSNKDPVTVLDAFAQAAVDLNDARLWIVTPGGPLAPAVSDRVRTSTALADRVVMMGPVAHEEIHRYYSAADVFVSGSHHEGSGYALLEALACGVLPCVTDIPAFQALAGESGVLWRPGDVVGCANALRRAAGSVSDARRQMVRRHFEQHLSWPAIARQTMAAYSALVSQRQLRV